jgi:ketosteroid isomerase-like protein
MAVTFPATGGKAMAVDHNDVQATVEKFFSALAAGDLASCEELFTDDAVVWHNFDELEQPKSDALAALSGFAHVQAEFDIIGRDFVDNTCIQRHVVRLSLPDGSMVTMPAIQRICCLQGRISRIDEYLDSAQLGPLVQALQAGA